MATVEMGRDGRVTLPAAVRKALGLAGGSRLEVEIRDGIVHLRPVMPVPQEDAWATTPEHRALLERALRDVAEGRVRGVSPDDLRRLAPTDETLLADLLAQDQIRA